jgi:hypothetical protein
MPTTRLFLLPLVGYKYKLTYCKELHMYSVYQHWDPLKTCIVGKSYPPEFYSWIKNINARKAMERVAQETEEDLQSLVRLLESFGVETLRPTVSGNHKDALNPFTNKYQKPPLTPRDYAGMFGNDLLFQDMSINAITNRVRTNEWPETEIYSYTDLQNLPTSILENITLEEMSALISGSENNSNPYFSDIFAKLSNNCNIQTDMFNGMCINEAGINTAGITRIGKDLYFGTDVSERCGVINNKSILHDAFPNNRVNLIDIDGHQDGAFCPVVPGLIISIVNTPTYKDTFPGWEVVYLPDQGLNKVKPFLELKRKNSGKWWIPGEESNDALLGVVETWLSDWVGYVEETVFDVNMLVINEKNVIVNNYNKQVFDALERYGVTPHICNFRHRYFWDGGLHCITLDVDREGEMKDYFPERG